MGVADQKPTKWKGEGGQGRGRKVVREGFGRDINNITAEIAFVDPSDKSNSILTTCCPKALGGRWKAIGAFRK